jgi:hypothetical protein
MLQKSRSPRKRKRKNLSLLDFASWLVFAITGRVIIHTWFAFPFPPFIKTPWWLEKLHTCDWCAGVWIYSILALVVQADIFSPYFIGATTIVGQIVTGIVTSYLVHVFVIGVKEKYAQPIVI